MQKPRLSLAQIWNMCFGFLGVQIAFGLQNANASRIFQTLGADVDRLALLWLAAPVTGLLVQPVIGYLSDKTWGPLGRRRPYVLVGALTVSAALLVMPQSPYLWIAASLLWILDASINLTMEPFRAFVGDLLPESQRTTGFAMQSLFIGAGAVFASALPWILSHLGVSNVAPAGVVPDSVRLAFYVGAAGVLITVLWTVVLTKEYAPAELAAFAPEPGEAERTGTSAALDPITASAYLRGGAIWLLGGGAATAVIAGLNLEKELYVLSVFSALFGVGQIVAGLAHAGGGRLGAFSEIMEDLYQMPRVMRQLALVQFFTWFGMFAMWIYTTPAVARVDFGAVAVGSRRFAEGADWVGLLFAVYNGVAALAAFLLPLVAARIGRRAGHMINLVLGGLGLVSFLVIRDPLWLLLSMVGVGIAWASILSAPYAILAGALPPGKMGVYMGIFNFFIVIPQILAATVLGLLLRTFFDRQAIWALGLGGGSLLIAAVAVLFVADPTDPSRRREPQSRTAT